MHAAALHPARPPRHAARQPRAGADRQERDHERDKTTNAAPGPGRSRSPNGWTLTIAANSTAA